MLRFIPSFNGRCPGPHYVDVIVILFRQRWSSHARSKQSYQNEMPSVICFFVFMTARRSQAHITGTIHSKCSPLLLCTPSRDGLRNHSRSHVPISISCIDVLHERLTWAFWRHPLYLSGSVDGLATSLTGVLLIPKQKQLLGIIKTLFAPS